LILISPLKLEILLAEDEKESPEVLIDAIEDRAIYAKLEKFGVDMDSAKAANFTHKQLLFLRDFLERYMKKKSKKSVSADRETDPPFLFTYVY
jgi:hypothetical protein